jgi:nicotinate-nucleotide adenylyltransferase
MPPHKTFPKGTPSPEGRLEMTRLAFRDVENCEISDIELRRAGESYTIDTLREISDINPGAELFLIVGTDMFLTLREWKDADEILRLATPVVTLRRADIKAEITDEIARQTELGATPGLIENDIVEISSSQLRSGFPERNFTWHIDERVYSYIIERGLYGAKPNFDWLRFEAYKRLSPERRIHVAGCEAEAVRLADRWDEDADEAREAAILHDITKKLTAEEQLALCAQYGISITDEMREIPKILHGHTAAEIASASFAASDAVKSAIKWHTTAHDGMTTLDKIIYIADTIEPNRDFDGVNELRRLAYSNLDAAVLACIDTVIKELLTDGRRIDTNTLAAARSINPDYNPADYKPN